MFPGMTLCPFHLHFQRVDAHRNMARYYMLSIEATLFGDVAVVRSWGRIGRRGREKSDLFANEQDAASHFLELARKKRRRGYTPARNSGTAGGARQSGHSGT